MNDEKNEKLMRAMSEIDDDLIAEAREYRHSRSRWVRWSALAACLALVMLCVPMILQSLTVIGGLSSKSEADMNDGMSEGMQNGEETEADAEADWESSAGVDSELSDDTIAGPGYDTIYDPVYEEISALYSKTDWVPLNEEEVTLSVGQGARNKKRILIYESSTGDCIRLLYSSIDFVPMTVSVTVNSADGKKVITGDGDNREWIKISVNGFEADDLPQDEGNFEIVIDLSAIAAEPSWQMSDRVWISGVGTLLLAEGTLE